MSRLIAKRLYLTTLLAAKQSSRCRFPIRSLNSSANLYNLADPSAVRGNEVSDNANPRRLWTLQDEDRLIGRVSKLEDRAHSSDDRFTTLAKDSATSKVDVSKAIGEMCSAMQATMAKHYMEHKSDMAKLSTDMGKMHVELKTDIAKFYVELSKAEEGIKSLSRQFKGICGAAVVVVGYIATKYPDEFLSFLHSVLARATPQSCQS